MPLCPYLLLQISHHPNLNNAVNPRINDFTKEDINQFVFADSTRAQLDLADSEKLRLEAPKEVPIDHLLHKLNFN